MNEMHSFPDAEALNSRSSSIGAAEAERLSPKIGIARSFEAMDKHEPSDLEKLIPKPLLPLGALLNGVDVNGSFKSILITFCSATALLDGSSTGPLG